MERSKLVLEAKGVERQEIDYVIPLVYGCLGLASCLFSSGLHFFFFFKLAVAILLCFGTSLFCLIHLVQVSCICSIFTVFVALYQIIKKKKKMFSIP